MSGIEKMSWDNVLNNDEHPWIRKTNEVLERSYFIDDLPYQLSKCIFDIKKDEFTKYVDFIAAITGSIPGQKVGEVGCGNGGLLLALQTLYGIHPSGVDISSALIDTCRKVFSDIKDDFNVGSIIEKPLDVCLMNSVSQYIPKSALFNIIHTTDAQKFILTDVKNITDYDDFVLRQAKRQGLTVDERNLKYRNTPLHYYAKQEFLSLPYNVKIYNMPAYYPDSQFSSYYVIIKK